MQFTLEEIREHEFDPMRMEHLAVKQVKPVERTIMPLAIPVVDRNQEVLGKLWIYNDVTGIKRQLEQLHTIVNASPLPVLVSRIRDGKVLFVNNHLAALLGYTLEDVQNKTTEEFLCHPDDRISLVDQLKKSGHFHDRELQVKKKDGTTV
jgi:PAS domain S-box-containing protein